MFHRIDDVWSMPGPRFFKLVWRLAAYQGVMQARALAEREKTPAERPFEYGQQSTPSGVDWNPGTAESIQADPALKQLFSFG